VIFLAELATSFTEKRNDVMTEKVRSPNRRNLGDEIRRVLCTLGVAAELVVAAGGDGPAPAGGGVPMYGFCTGLAIVGWWVAAAAAGELVNVLRSLPSNGSCVGRRMHLPWGRVVLPVVVIAVVIVVRIWQPVPPMWVIAN